MTLERLDVYRFMETSHVTQRELLREFDPEFDAGIELRGKEVGSALRRIRDAGNWESFMGKVREWHVRVFPDREEKKSALPPTEKLEMQQTILKMAVRDIMDGGPWPDQQVESSVTIGPDGARIVVVALVPKEAWDK